MLRAVVPILCLLSASAWALQTGDSRADVLAELGKPKSTMAAGNREFLTYPQGRVELTDGKVTAWRGGFAKPDAVKEVKSTQPKPSPKPPPGAMVSKGHWFTDLEAAKQEAARTNKRILALFTGSDWCPPCQQFEAQVAHDDQFVGIFAPSFVFFKNDWLRNTPQPPAIADEVNRLRRTYDISYYPTLKILGADGEELDEVAWTKVRGGTLKEAMIEAIDDSRKATAGGKKAPSSWWPF